jgi:uncharacterized protein
MWSSMERRKITRKFEGKMSDKILSSYIKKLDINLRHRFSKDACHDMYHLYRVYSLALKIQSKEGGDRIVIGVAAFLHDIHRVIQSETGKYCNPEDSLPVVKKILYDVDFPKDKIPSVLHVIAHHEEYSFAKRGKTVNDIETLIVQDADNLDAMGAIGIGRAFGFASLLGRPMWNPNARLNKRHYEESKSDTDPSTLHHFHSKLLKLKDNMHTKTAKKMALVRHNYMLQFLKQFTDEWYGRR